MVGRFGASTQSQRIGGVRPVGKLQLGLVLGQTAQRLGEVIEQIVPSPRQARLLRGCHGQNNAGPGTGEKRRFGAPGPESDATVRSLQLENLVDGLVFDAFDFRRIARESRHERTEHRHDDPRNEGRCFLLRAPVRILDEIFSTFTERDKAGVGHRHGDAAAALDELRIHVREEVVCLFVELREVSLVQLHHGGSDRQQGFRSIAEVLSVGRHACCPFEFDVARLCEFERKIRSRGRAVGDPQFLVLRAFRGAKRDFDFAFRSGFVADHRAGDEVIALVRELPE